MAGVPTTPVFVAIYELGLSVGIIRQLRHSHESLDEPGQENDCCTLPRLGSAPKTKAALSLKLNYMALRVAD